MDDDTLIGRLFSRREALALLGVAVVAGREVTPSAAGQTKGPAGCVVRPELTEGPYFAEGQPERSDIRVEPSTGALQSGVPLSVTFAVTQLTGGRCSPLAGAVVDLWQCDAAGVYSSVRDPRFGDTSGQSFLRGLQRTTADGTARFATIYPGWYQGRAVHLHFKIRTAAPGSQAYEFTSQLFFPEALTDRIHAEGPYAKKGRRDTLNEQDFIYRQGGDQLLLQPARTDGGYGASIALALDLADAAVGRSDSRRRPGRPPE